ncbi:MAG TPA: flagellar hook assembly protein FlgD [Noviherbaspirillum sp.]|nr:flagellar hook assembly protein FlgD [Noviherbaspirillum sp.]
MTTVQTNTVSSDLLATMNGPSKKTTANTIEDAQNRFMTLLVTQMRNQDPLNPLDNAQVTSQLAQLSTVTGIDKLNATLEALQSSYNATQSLQAANMIGHGVLVPGKSVQLSGGKAILGVDMTESADSVQVTIRNASGVAVRTIDLGGQQAGTLPLGWDGKMDSGATAPDGAYTFEVAATRNGKEVKATGLAFGEVASVTTGAQGVTLNVPGVGTVKLGDIRQIL